MASYVCWGRGRGALAVMSQGHNKEEQVKGNRRKKVKSINIIQKRNTWMPAESRGTVL